MHRGNVVVVSPRLGPLANRFIDIGAAIRTGDIFKALEDISDVFVCICNTIMTADIIVKMAKRSHPTIWILHEWWTDEMIVENLKLRNMTGLDIGTVKDALSKANHVVCVCEAQRKLYSPSCPSSAIYVGVPAPVQQTIQNTGPPKSGCIFLTLGIVCPRKNQSWAVQQFKAFAKGRTDVKLVVVGARYTRPYEAQYVEKV
jgi:glycosyltransferase involved in cell wall biosynthesis